ncbi:ATP adenylyltransferase-domain-containing protein [Zopfochytrium polystomum]|nr:ATP adenylyltransferase-domain-containing protein [Zopfochytrium polystomum]
MALLTRGRIVAAADAAVASGHLVFTRSTAVVVPAPPPPPLLPDFEIRLAPSLAKKPTGGLSKPPAATPPPDAAAAAKIAQPLPSKPRPNPFLTPEPELTLAEFGRHRLLLNKFAVVKGHIILTTKEWESQSEPISASDFEAAGTVLFDIPPEATPADRASNPDDAAAYSGEYLGFYNCGPNSGASVPHRHLQFVPLAAGAATCTFEAHFRRTFPAAAALEALRSPHLPFVHAAAFLPAPPTSSATATAAADWARAAAAAYTALLDAVRVAVGDGDDDGAAGGLGSHNVVISRRWMIVVPRRREAAAVDALLRVDGGSGDANGSGGGAVTVIGVNGLGFAGMMLAKSNEELDAIKAVGGLRILREVCFSA